MLASLVASTRPPKLGDWCITPILLRPAIKSHLRGGRSPQNLDVSTDMPAVSGFASIRTSKTRSGRCGGAVSAKLTFLRASRRREFYTSHLATLDSHSPTASGASLKYLLAKTWVERTQPDTPYPADPSSIQCVLGGVAEVCDATSAVRKPARRRQLARSARRRRQP
jgi:hypothetical protein